MPRRRGAEAVDDLDLQAGSDVRVSTLERYVAALGRQLDLRTLPRIQARASEPPAKGTP